MVESSTPSSGRWPRDRCKRPGRARRLAVILAAGALAAIPGSSAAQTVVGQLLDADSRAPVEGALLLLLDQGGSEVGGFLSNQNGRFMIRAPGPGTYTVRAERIGYETVDSDPFRLEVTGQVGINLETAQTAIELEEIRIEGTQRCVVHPAEGLQLAGVWEEARKALTVQNWTEREGRYRFQITRYERMLDETGRVESETRQTQSGVAASPIRSLPAEDLMAEGFIRPTPDRGWEYFGPDASVLLSDQFLDSHCFSLTMDRNRPGSLGLHFEPVERSEFPDISGTLWLDAASARIEFLEYRYSWLPWVEGLGVARGRVEFESLPNGAWVIPRWWIRMPVMAEDISFNLQTRPRIRVVGIKEVGGEITQFSSMDRSVTVVAPTGMVEGLVWDSTSQAPLGGATVFLSGTQYAAETDAGGRFIMADLPGGTFTAVFTHPRLDSLGTHSSGVTVDIVPGELTSVQLGIPSGAASIEAICAEDELEDREGAVIGFVREEGGRAPVRGARITVSWSEFGSRAGAIVEYPYSLETTSGPTGRYTACGVPPGTVVTVTASHEGRNTRPVRVTALSDGYTVVDLILPG